MSEQTFDAPPDPVLEELRDEIYTLRTLLSVSLISLIVLALSVDRYLLKQISIETTKAQINNGAVYNSLYANPQFSLDKASDLWKGLVTYSKTHPDLVPLVGNGSKVVDQTFLVTPPPAAVKK